MDKTHITRPKERLSSVTVSEADDKSKHRAIVVQAVEGYLRGRGSKHPGRGQSKDKQKEAPRPLSTSITPKGRLASIIIYVYVTKYSLWSEQA